MINLAPGSVLQSSSTLCCSVSGTASDRLRGTINGGIDLIGRTCNIFIHHRKGVAGVFIGTGFLPGSSHSSAHNAGVNGTLSMNSSLAGPVDIILCGREAAFDEGRSG